MKPIIGINMSTCRDAEAVNDILYLREAYIRAVDKVGGVPILLPVVASTALIADMVNQIGRSAHDRRVADIFRRPAKEPHRETAVLPELTDLMTQHPRRHVFDLALCRLSLDRNLPVLGICRGHQTLNEAAGGTMVLDLAKVTPDVSLSAGTRQCGQPSDNHRGKQPFETNNSAISGAPPGQQNAPSGGRAPGTGIYRIELQPGRWWIESIESRSHDFAVGVQFHPELLL